MTLLCIAGHFWWYAYGINNEKYFLLFRQTLQAWLVSLRIFSGKKCLRFPLSPVYSQLNFILMASVPTMEMTCPSMFSRTLTLAWSDPLCLVLKTHDVEHLSIDLPARITISIFHRLRLNQFLRKRGNKVVLELVCTQSGRVEQLSAPTEYMVKNDVTFSIV